MHLYCIVPDAVQPPAGTAGIGGAPVEAVMGPRLATWVSRHESAPVATAESVRAHNAVVAAAMTSDITPVPLRFGQHAADEDGVRRSSDADAEHWLALLARFAGHVEYGVHVAPAVEQEQDTVRDVRPPNPPTGKDYMAALARRQAAVARWKAEAERFAAEVQARAGELIRESRIEAPAAAGAAFRLAHLVAWSGADAYHSVIERLAGERRDLHVVRTGPWPPYSFVA